MAKHDAILRGTQFYFDTGFTHILRAKRLGEVDEWYGPVCRQLGTGRDYANPSTLLGQLRAEFT